MKKAELLANPPAMIKNENKKKKVVLSGRIIKTSEGQVLETDVWWNGLLSVRHFTSKKRWWNYQVVEAEWTSHKLGTVLAPWAGYGWPDVEEASIKIAATNFFEKLDRTVHFRIEWHEDILGYKASARQYKNRVKRETDEMRGITPALPGDFAEFVRKNAPKPGQNVNIQMYQQTRDGRFMERQFCVRAARDSEGTITTITEECRGITSAPGKWWDSWMYGVDYGLYGARQRFARKKKDTCVHQLHRTFILYTGNLKTLGLGDEKVRALKKISQLCKKAEWSFVLRILQRGEAFEHFLGAGLEKVAAEYAKDGCIKYNDQAKTMHGYFGITPQQLAYLKEANGGWRSVRMLQADKEGKLRVQHLKIIEKVVNVYTRDQWADLVDRGLPFMHIYALLGAETGRVTSELLRTYMDYLDMAEQRGNDIHDEIIYRHKRWREFHDRYAAEKRIEAVKKDQKKFAGIRKDYKRNCELFAWEKNGYCIEIPKTYKDIILEGQQQHHCVGASDRYMLSMANRESWILFLRKSGDKKTPYYTIEATTDRVVQFYAAYDRQPDKEIVKGVLDDWMKQVKKNARKLAKAEKGAA